MNAGVLHKDMNRQSVAVIIPAYNEAQTIGNVVRVVVACKKIDQVIVVSDGSSDETGKIAKVSGATIVDLQKNTGKGGALLEGLKQTDASIIVFLDADLIGLTEKHIDQLLEPVLNGSRVMQVGMRDRGIFWTKLAHHFPLISGERAVRRDVIDGTPVRFYLGFMIEIALNYYCRSRGLPYGAVDLKGLSIRRKYQKVGWPKAVIQYSKMTAEIILCMIRVRLARLFGKF
jgi:glycosyltransferase involved in cell wall biosynthesis